jgi:cobalt-zinc-cadmium efflux system outer membrane protein
MVRQALAERAELRESRHALEAARAEARLASRERVPNPRIGATYSREEESATSIVQGVLAFDLPLFNRNTAIRGMTAARVSQLEVALEATERRIKREVLTSLDRVRAARAAADGYADDVVKAMQQNMDLATDSYRAGKIDFLQLAVIRRQAVEARGEYIDVLEELNAAQAQLNRALGWSRGLDLGPSAP